MTRSITQIVFGLGVGIALQFILPRHHSIGLLLTAALSMAGAIAGELAVERLLPVRERGMIGFASTAVGAIAMLLVYGVAASY